MEDELTLFERVTLKLIDAFETIEAASEILAASNKKIAEEERRTEHYLKLCEQRNEVITTLKSDIACGDTVISDQEKTIQAQEEDNRKQHERIVAMGSEIDELRDKIDELEAS